MSGTLRSWLAHPLTRGLDLDDPATTSLRRQIIAGKPFLNQLYAEWFELIRASLPAGEDPILELGSGATEIHRAIPGVITSEVFRAPGVSLVADGRALPFKPGSLRALLLVDVMHHIPDVEQFFGEAAACVRPGGAILAVEPWVTSWSSFVYRNLHHEPFDPSQKDWRLPAGGPLSGANGALPWIVLERDRSRFERTFPEWRISSIRPLMPATYLLSGGVSLRSLAPGWSYPVVRGAERLLDRWSRTLAMFAVLVISRTNEVSREGGPRAIWRPPGGG